MLWNIQTKISNTGEQRGITLRARSRLSSDLEVIYALMEYRCVPLEAALWRGWVGAQWNSPIMPLTLTQTWVNPMTAPHP
jgi:hypothetical protein